MIFIVTGLEGGAKQLGYSLSGLLSGAVDDDGGAGDEGRSLQQVQESLYRRQYACDCHVTYEQSA